MNGRICFLTMFVVGQCSKQNDLLQVACNGKTACSIKKSSVEIVCLLLLNLYDLWWMSIRVWCPANDVEKANWFQMVCSSFPSFPMNRCCTVHCTRSWTKKHDTFSNLFYVLSFATTTIVSVSSICLRSVPRSTTIHFKNRFELHSFWLHKNFATTVFFLCLSYSEGKIYQWNLRENACMLGANRSLQMFLASFCLTALTVASHIYHNWIDGRIEWFSSRRSQFFAHIFFSFFVQWLKYEDHILYEFRIAEFTNIEIFSWFHSTAHPAYQQ